MKSNILQIYFLWNNKTDNVIVIMLLGYFINFLNFIFQLVSKNKREFTAQIKKKILIRDMTLFLK